MNYTNKDFSISSSLFDVSPKTYNKQFNSKCIEDIKSKLKSFASENCYHIIEHDLKKINGEHILTIEYI